MLQWWVMRDAKYEDMGTYRRTRSVQHAFKNTMVVHPSIDLRLVYLVASDLKDEPWLVDFHKLSFLSFLDNISHLLRLDAFI